MPWSRNTLWRQGSILAQQDFLQVGLSDSCSYDLAIAISHDCDIANDKLDVEPFVDFIGARIIEQQNGNCTNGKNPRILHLSYKTQEKTIFLELLALDKFRVEKSSLENIQPDKAYELANTCEVLQSWLAARYRRHALPNSLVDRLNKVFDHIEKEGKKNSNGVLSFRLSYEPRDELLPDEAYELSLTIVYSTDGQEYKEMAEKIVASLEAKFPELLKKTKDFGTVDLRRCEAVSEMEFTVRDMRDTVEFHLEHLSYRTEPSGPTI